MEEINFQKLDEAILEKIDSILEYRYDDLEEYIEELGIYVNPMSNAGGIEYLKAEINHIRINQDKSLASIYRDDPWGYIERLTDYQDYLVGEKQVNQLGFIKDWVSVIVDNYKIEFLQNWIKRVQEEKKDLDINVFVNDRYSLYLNRIRKALNEKGKMIDGRFIGDTGELGSYYFLLSKDEYKSHAGFTKGGWKNIFNDLGSPRQQQKQFCLFFGVAPDGKYYENLKKYAQYEEIPPKYKTLKTFLIKAANGMY
jgi:hypothetical protein